MRGFRSDAAVVRAARRGDRDASAEIVRRHAPAAWRAAWSVTGRRDLAEEAAQEGILRALDRLATFDEQRPFAPWLARVVVNVALRSAERETRAVRAPVPDRAVAAEIGEQHEGQPVRAAVLGLPDEQREIVALRYWADLGVAEIAALLDVPAGTVASRLSRALDRLRTTLEQEAP